MCRACSTPPTLPKHLGRGGGGVPITRGSPRHEYLCPKHGLSSSSQVATALINLAANLPALPASLPSEPTSRGKTTLPDSIPRAASGRYGSKQWTGGSGGFGLSSALPCAQPRAAPRSALPGSQSLGEGDLCRLRVLQLPACIARRHGAGRASS